MAKPSLQDIKAEYRDYLELARHGDPGVHDYEHELASRVPTLVAALEAVLKLHKPRREYDQYERVTVFCDSCTDADDRYVTDWPCSTVNRINQHLEIN